MTKLKFIQLRKLQSECTADRIAAKAIFHGFSILRLLDRCFFEIQLLQTQKTCIPD